VKNTSYDPHNVSIKWFEDGTLNVSANCVDRHLATRGDQPRSSGKATTPSDAQDHHLRSCTTRCKLANVLKAMGVKKGDRVCSTCR
jgi:acetyl-CoA synthetase